MKTPGWWPSGCPHSPFPATRSTTIASPRRHLRTLILLAAAVGCLAAASSGFAALTAPTAGGQACNSATVDSLPAFSWSSVSGAYQYEYEIAASSDFQSPANSGQDDYFTKNTRVSIFKAQPSGTYYWRVRALNNATPVVSSAWSNVCTFTLDWADTPSLTAPADTATVTFPSPLVFQWTPATGAKSYKLTVSQSPDLSNPISAGSVSFPLTTNATAYSPTTRLAQGTYYWDVTPIDAEGNSGTPSAVHSFTWSWPSTDTTLNPVADLDPSSEVTDPQFSWSAIPGAASYQIEINSDQNFSSSGKVCCSDTIISTTFSPTTLLPADTYYWRIRAEDPNGDFGDWVVAPSTFDVSYDTGSPSISNLSMVDSNDNPVSGSPLSTDTPILSWSPTPGAASYSVDVVPYTTSCQWAAGTSAWHIETAATAWTPMGTGLNASNPWPNSGHSSVTTDSTSLSIGTTYCVRVRALRNNDTNGDQVYGDYTYLNGFGNPAFTFTGYPTGGSCTAPCNPAINIGAGDYILPAATGNTRLPLFTWNPIAGDQSYFVIVATDPQFQHVFDEAFTQIPAYAPRTGSGPINYLDTNTNYYWAVLPAPNADGSGVSGDPTSAGSYPQTFDFHSVAPTALEPTPGQVITTQPTFEWSPVDGALQYRLLVSTDPSFGTLVGGTPVTTDSTSYTGTNFPASAHLYWEVQAIDKSGNGLAYSTPQQFQKTLAVPTFSGTGYVSGANPGTADGIPILEWDEMPGAVRYNLTIQNGTSTSTYNDLQTTAFVPQSLRGTGNFTWTVAAQYPTTGQNVTSGYGPGTPMAFTRTIAAPTGMLGTVGGQHQVLLTWTPKAGAASYAIQVGTNDQFTSGVFDSPFTRPEYPVYAPDLTSSQYFEGGKLYWRIAEVDADGNQGAWSAPQLLTLPTVIHGSSSTGAAAHLATTTIKVYAKNAAGAAISGVLVKDSGAGVVATSHTTSSGGYVTFKVHPTKKGTITFTLTKTGCISTTVKVTSY
jgi:hypothetical protein